MNEGVEKKVFYRILAPDVLVGAVATVVDGSPMDWAAYIAPWPADESDITAAVETVCRGGTKLDGKVALAIFPNMAAAGFEWRD